MARQEPAPALKITPEPEPIIGPVQGQLPQSKNEYFVAVALDKLGIPFMYQFAIGGGRGIRGGIVVDFVTMNPPGARPVFVGEGGYWHNKRQQTEEDLAHATAAHYFNTQVIDLTEEETSTQAKAFRAVQEKIA